MKEQDKKQLPTPDSNEEYNKYDNQILSNEQESRKESLRERNRLAAQRARQKKRNIIQELETQVSMLNNENLALRRNVDDLMLEYSSYQDKISELISRIQMLERQLQQRALI